MAVSRHVTLVRLAAILVMLSASRSFAQNGESPGFAPQVKIPTGVYEINHTVIIPRLRRLPRDGNKAQTGVPAPFLGKQTSTPGGWLRGDDEFGTVLRFGPNVTGAMIETEDYGAHAGAHWNDANTEGDKTLHAVLACKVSDLTIDGGAELRSCPWGYPEGSPRPDPHGPDFPFRADALCVQCNGFVGDDIRFFQIPGTALRLKSGSGIQQGPTSIYDADFSELTRIHVVQAMGGIVVDSADAKLRSIFITGIVHDGLTMNGPGAVVDVDHVWGADRSVVVSQPAVFHAAYHEAARIGTDIVPGGEGTQIHGLNIGPATCWYRGLKLGAHGCTILGLHGSVMAESAAHPDIAGVEIMPRMVNEYIQGAIVVDGEGSTGMILRGQRGKIDIKGGWNKRINATFVRVAEPVTGETVELHGAGDGGIVLDLSASGLDRTDGRGNEFKIKWAGNAIRVIYPGGGTKYNLAPGNQLWIDGRLQGIGK